MNKLVERIVGRGDLARSLIDERELLGDELARMGGAVERLSMAALDAVTRRDTEAAQSVADQRSTLGEMQGNLERRIVRVIAGWRPAEKDVTHLISALKISAHLERIGELSCNNAMRTVALNDAEPLVLMSSLDRMGRRVVQQLKNALDAFARLDPDVAQEAWRRDDDVDDAYNSLFKELLVNIANDPQMSGPCTHLMFVAKNVERIGDHATDIAAIVYGLATGGELSRGEPEAPKGSGV